MNRIKKVPVVKRVERDEVAAVAAGLPAQVSIGLDGMADVIHYGTADETRAQRAVTLDAAYATNPARFRHRRPQPPKLPTVAWINEPTPEALIKSA